MQLNSPSKLLYISPRELLKNRADAVHIMYSYAAFANLGLQVTLLAALQQIKTIEEFREVC